MIYPEQFLRGVSTEDSIRDNAPLLMLFLDFQKNKKRDIPFIELSITWFENSEAMSVLRAQKKDNGEIQFKHGVVVLSTMQLEKCKKMPIIRGNLQYEKYHLDENIYHGNILIPENIEKLVRNHIASSIALLCFEEYIP